jgi:transcription initiation factor TFIID subunit 5
VYGLAFIPGTDFLISCSEDTTLRAWDYKSGVNKALYRGHTYPVWSVDVDRLGLSIATGVLTSGRFLKKLCSGIRKVQPKLGH